MSLSWALLRDRSFARLAIARTSSMGGSSFAPVALSFGILHLPHGNAELLSVVLTAEMVPLLTFMLIGGMLADRFPRQQVMMAGEFLSALSFAALGLMLLFSWTSPLALCTAAAFSGLGIAIMSPALTGIIPEVLPPEHLQQGNALLALGANTARILGLVSAGAVVSFIGAEWALISAAVLFGAAGTLVGSITGIVDRRGEENASMLAQLRHGWREFSSRQWLWVVTVQFSFMVLAFEACFGVLGPVLAETEMGGAMDWTLVLLGDAVGMVLGVLLAMRIRTSRPILVGVLLTATGAPPFIALALGAPLWIVVSLAVIMGASFDIFGVLWNTTMQCEVPSEALSRVSAYDSLGSLMFGPIGLLLAGHAVVWFGIRESMLGASALMLIAVGVALLSPDVRRARPGDAGLAASSPTDEPATCSEDVC